jgi:hypothetical protein
MDGRGKLEGGPAVPRPSLQINHLNHKFIMPQPKTPEQQLAHYHLVKEIILQEEMWERVPEHAKYFSPESLENLVKYAYFAGFIDMSQVLRLLFLDKKERSRLLTKWYEEIREKGCWLC